MASMPKEGEVQKVPRIHKAITCLLIVQKKKKKKIKEKIKSRKIN